MCVRSFVTLQAAVVFVIIPKAAAAVKKKKKKKTRRQEVVDLLIKKSPQTSFSLSPVLEPRERERGTAGSGGDGGGFTHSLSAMKLDPCDGRRATCSSLLVAFISS